MTTTVVTESAVVTDDKGIVSPTQDVIPAELRTAWNEAIHEVALAEKQAEKAVRRMQVGRVYVARVLVQISAIPALCKKNGSMNQSALADALGIHKTQVSHYFKGIRLFDKMVTDGLATREEAPTEAEVEAINTHWHELANKARQARLGKNVTELPKAEAPKPVDSTKPDTEGEVSPAQPELEVTAPSADDIFAKVHELSKVIGLLESAGVKVSRADADKFFDAMGELSAQLEGIVAD